jgi:hypothetical protein
VSPPSALKDFLTKELGLAVAVLDEVGLVVAVEEAELGDDDSDVF